MYNVFIVDDEPLIIDSLIKPSYWDDLGIEVIGSASNGKEALDFIKSNHVDILITDINMPIMDGLELIKSIRDFCLNINMVIISGYDDFAFVKKAIKYGVENYLLKPIDKIELAETIIDIINKLQVENNKTLKIGEYVNVFKENILQKLALNTITKKEFSEKVQMANLNLEWDSFYAVIVKTMRREDHQEQDLTKEDTISNWFNKRFRANIMGAFFYDHANDLVAFVNSSVDVSCFNKFALEIRQLTGEKIFITVGDVAISIWDAHISYSTAKRLQGYCYLLDENNNIVSDKIINETITRNKYYRVNYDMYINLLIAKKRDECIRFIKVTLEEMKKRDEPTIAFKNVMLEILLHTSNVIKKISMDTTDLPKEIKYLYLNFESAVTPEEIMNVTCEVVDKSINYIETRENNTSSLIKQVIDYVNQNLDFDLSLKYLSNKFSVNASYLGQLFKKEQGIMFSNYLNNVRIEKSKELITNSNMKIYDISKKVGFLDPSHFYKLFKNYTGLSPAEYREKINR